MIPLKRKNVMDGKLNKKRRNQLLLQSRFEDLKLIVDEPSLAQIEDVGADNLLLLNNCKSTRNAVPVQL